MDYYSAAVYSTANSMFPRGIWTECKAIFGSVCSHLYAWRLVVLELVVRFYADHSVTKYYSDYMSAARFTAQYKLV